MGQGAKSCATSYVNGSVITQTGDHSLSVYSEEVRCLQGKMQEIHSTTVCRESDPIGESNQPQQQGVYHSSTVFNGGWIGPHAKNYCPATADQSKKNLVLAHPARSGSSTTVVCSGSPTQSLVLVYLLRAPLYLVHLPVLCHITHLVESPELLISRLRAETGDLVPGAREVVPDVALEERVDATVQLLVAVHRAQIQNLLHSLPRRGGLLHHLI